MNKKKLFCLLAALALAFSLCGAQAEGGNRVVTWKVTAAEIDVDALLRLTYTTQDGTLLPSEESKEDTGPNSRYWTLKGQEDGTPYCSLHTRTNQSTTIQSEFWIYRQTDDSPYAYAYTLDSWNSVPKESGFSAARADDTLRAGMAALEQLGLNGAKAVFFTTLGRMTGTTKCRKVYFEETLEGLPVRWSSESLYDSRSGRMAANKCHAELVFSDEEGMVKASGFWSAFEPLTRADRILSDEEIAAVFTAAGFRDPQPEACWFLHLDGENATATLARRVENSYVSAVDGSWLQTGK